MYPSETSGYSTLSSPFRRPAMKNTLENRYIPTPAAIGRLRMLLSPSRNFVDPIFRKTAPNEPINDPNTTSRTQNKGFFLPPHPPQDRPHQYHSHPTAPF